MTACTGEARAMDVISDVVMKLLRDTLNPKWRTLRVHPGPGPELRQNILEPFYQSTE